MGRWDKDREATAMTRSCPEKDNFALNWLFLELKTDRKKSGDEAALRCKHPKNTNFDMWIAQIHQKSLANPQKWPLRAKLTLTGKCEPFFAQKFDKWRSGVFHTSHKRFLLTGAKRKIRHLKTSLIYSGTLWIVFTKITQKQKIAYQIWVGFIYILISSKSSWFSIPCKAMI